MAALANRQQKIPKSPNQAKKETSNPAAGQALVRPRTGLDGADVYIDRNVFSSAIHFCQCAVLLPNLRRREAPSERTYK